MLAVILIVAVALLVAVSVSVFLDVPHGASLRDAIGNDYTARGIPTAVRTAQDRVSRKHRRRAPRHGGGARFGDRSPVWSMQIAVWQGMEAAA